MQGWSLERKIRVTQTRIMEWYMRYDGQVFISFSGGKDSTVLLDLARRVYPDVMDIGQMCEALGVSTKTGYKLLKDGKIEYLKIGRAYRIPKAHILRYLKITCSTFAE